MTEKMSIQERAKLDVEQQLEQLRWLYGITMAEFTAWQKLSGVIGVNMVADEDEMFKRFCAERHSWFKPSIEQQQREYHLKSLQDPELLDAFHDIEDRMHDEH